MPVFAISRAHGERGAASSLAAVFALFSAVIFTGAHVVPLALEVERRTEINQAFSLAIPRAVRVGVTDSSGRLSLLAEDETQEELVNYLRLYKKNVSTEVADKSFCVGVFDTGNGADCTTGQFDGSGPYVCPKAVYRRTSNNRGKGWRYDGSECDLPESGTTLGAILSQVSGDSASGSRWDRFYAVVTKLDNEKYVQVMRVDSSPRGSPTASVQWSPPPGGSSAGSGGLTINVNPPTP
ncbi:MAG: hypothetical protein RL417_2169 [Pseudomonadota bacterium]|jgi:hypothetical protein